MSRRPSASRRGAAAVLLAALPCLPSCFAVQLTYSRAAVESPMPEAVFATLTPGTAALGACLERVGAPLLVREGPRGGAVLAYGWSEQSGWEFDASYGLSDDGLAGVSVGFDNGALDLVGVVLWFDENLMLQRMRRGSLRDLLRADAQQPAVIDEGR